VLETGEARSEKKPYAYLMTREPGGAFARGRKDPRETQKTGKKKLPCRKTRGEHSAAFSPPTGKKGKDDSRGEVRCRKKGKEKETHRKILPDADGPAARDKSKRKKFGEHVSIKINGVGPESRRSKRRQGLRWKGKN